MLAYLSLGSNLGDREASIREALERLRKLQPELRPLRVAAYYETAPLIKGTISELEKDPQHIPSFLNTIVEVETQLAANDLLDRLLTIEKSMGRQRSKAEDEGTPGSFRPFLSRNIDLDIVFYGDQVIRTSRLTIPHPRAHRRSFVMLPMHDLRPEFVHPVLGQSIAEICMEPLEPEILEKREVL